MVAKFLALLLALIPTLTFAFPSTPILDTFDRTDEDPITGIWTNGTSSGTGQCSVSSNLAVGGGSTDDCYTTKTYGATQEVYASIPNATTMTEDDNLLILLCLQGTFGSTSINGYAIKVRRRAGLNDQIEIVRMTNGYTGLTTLGSGWSAGEFSSGLKVGLRREASGSLSLYYDPNGASGWTLIETVTGATTYACGNTSLGLELGGANHSVNDFGGGSPIGTFSIIQAR